jgi:glycerol-3-phosphate dehydrogenase
MYDVLIIGAGIVGSFLAHDLSKKELKVAVIEKEADVANRATMANSAIIHSGHDPLEGTLKAKLNVRGNEMYESICKDLGVTFKRTSAFVVATSKEEEETLDILYDQAKNRNIPVMLLTREDAIEKEPNLSDYVTRVIELPSTGIVYPWEVAIALAEEAIQNGVEFHLKEEVQKIEKKENAFKVYTNNGRYESKIVINAAGTYSDKIYGMVSKEVEFKITPRKGEYFVLDKLQNPLVSRVIYPVPSSIGKGVLVVPTTHGNVLLGPNSEIVDSDELNNNTKENLDYVKREIGKTVKNIPMQNIIRTFAGLRPTSTIHDFIIEEAKDVINFINVAGIESPGLASAPAISEYVINELLSDKINMNNKENYTKRRPVIKPKELNDQERNELVKKEPAYGRVVCRCEQITEGEILDAIRRPLGAKTVKGVKKRVRPGMGRCQGGFCEPLVVDILARELDISPMEVRLDSDNSVMLMSETKE